MLNLGLSARAARNVTRRLLMPWVCVIAFALAACAGDKSLYEGHRGKYPADYKAKIQAAIESRWPAPRKFQVLAITEPTEGYLVAKNYWQPQSFRDYRKYGAWLGCIHIKGIKNRGADFAEMDIPYLIASHGTAVALTDEPGCRHAPYQPWADMKDGIEATLPARGVPAGS
jgi:hypothetical protein